MTKNIVSLKPSTTVKATENIFAMSTRTLYRTNNKNRLTIALIFWAIVVTGFVTVSVNAQGQRNTDKSPDQALRSNARVNPSTLAMEMSIPLFNFPGRAGSSISNTLNYSSKVWQYREQGAFVNVSGSWGITVRPWFARRTAAGWTSTLAPPRIEIIPEKFPYYMDSGCGYDGELWSNIEYPEGCSFSIYYMKRVTVTMPDGSSREFRASDAPVACGTNGNPCNNPDMTGTYLSVDGTRTRLDITSNSSTMFMPNGDRVIFGSGLYGVYATSIIDVHGNVLSYSETNKEWTDTMGRVLPNPLPSNLNFTQDQTVGDQVIELPGLGSETHETTLSWRYLKHPSSSDPDDSGLGDLQQDLAYPADLYCVGASWNQISGNTLFDNTAISTVRLCNYGTSFPGPTFNPIVLTRITLANGQSYRFEYNLFGEIEKIIYPTGAYERFVYDEVEGVQASLGPYDQANRGVVDRYVSEKGDGTDELHWEYGITRGTWISPAPFVVSTTNPDGTTTQQHLFDENDPTLERPYGFDKVTTGRPYDERVYSSDTIPVLLSRKLTVYDVTGPLSGGYSGSGLYSGATRDLRPVKEISITFEPSASNALATMTETIYDTTGNSDEAYFSSLNPKQTKKYHYKVVSASTAISANPTTAAGWFSSGDLATVTEMDYLYDSNYKARNINGLVTETRVKDAAGNVKAKTQITYDGETLLDETESTRWENPNSNYRGLVTKTRSWYDIGGNLYIDTKAQYDLMGNLRKTWDGRNNMSETQYSSTYDYAYPTSVITPIPDSSGTYGSSTAFTSSTVYDYNTGLPTSTTDANGQTTTMLYEDPLLRPTKVIAPNGAETVTEYGAGTDAASRWVKVTSDIDETNSKYAYTWFDGLGRTWLSQSEDSAGDVFAVTCYDNMGRVSKTSNPFRNVSNPNCSSSLEWTTPGYDDLGRTITVTTPDSAVVNTSYGLATTGSQIGTVVTVTDQAGKLRRSITNALGQRTRVDEPNSGLGSISSPNQATTYAYDTLNNLTGVTQGSQSRSFSYDALSRLKSATNPESGTVDYTYDANGNLATKTDARSISTTYTYDRLNRATLRNYSDSTPDVTYYYDNLTNARGKLIKVSSSVSTTEYTAFDIQGQVTQSKQITDGITYGNGSTDSLMTYSYNLAGDLVEQQYPSGRLVKNTYDTADGSLSQVQSKRSGETYRNFANSFSYTPDDEVERVRLGNGRWEMTTFNSRRQATMVGLGVGASTPNLLKLDYNYGTATANNGNLVAQTITVPGLAHPFVQAYTYDALDRLTVAEETQNSTQTWKQTFIYDRYGNRRFVTGSPTTLLSVSSSTPKVADPEALTTNNRFKEDQDADTVADYQYDTTGNLTLNAAGHSFTYDAENRQITATGTGLSTMYSYDGNGKRVKSYNAISDQTTIYVYDASDDLIAEYTINVPAPSNPTTSYLTEDAVGSVRAITDAYGQVKARRDFLPFGEEIYSGIASRNTAQKYSSSDDDTKKKFATYQRDVETGLDYAQSRYYSPMHGRFTSPDEFKGGPDELFDFTEAASDNPTFYADIENPQSLNKYQYGYNSPYKFNDPTGHCPPCLGQVFLGPTITETLPFIIPKSNIISRIGPYVEAGAATAVRTGAIDPILVPNMPLPSSRIFRPVGRVAGEAGGSVNLRSTPRGPRRSAKPTGGKKGGREGKPFTPRGKREVIDKNKAANDGKTKCDTCGVETVPGKKTEKGVPRPANETQVDHIDPKSNGGSGTPDNGQVLCRICNQQKGAKVPKDPVIKP